MLRFVRRLLAFIVFVVVAGLAGAFLPRPLVAPFLDEDGAAVASARRTILLLSNPIHTDIALPADLDVVERFAFLEGSGLPLRHPEALWIIAGWGGREFYTRTPQWSDLRPGPLFRALTLDRSVMHMVVAGAIDEDAPAVQRITVSADRFAAILDAIEGGFARGPGGEPRLIAGAAYGEADQFFEGNGRFNAFLGCNTWTSAVLREGGLRTGWWNPLPQSLAWSLRLYNDCEGPFGCVPANGPAEIR